MHKKYQISQQRFSSEQIYNYGLMKMSKISIFIKRNVLGWQLIKKIDTFEIFNSGNTLYLSPYIKSAFWFYAH